MFAFLLVVPFNTGWKMLFRHHEKRYLVDMGNRLAIAGISFLALALTGILVLLSSYVVGGVAPIIVGVLTFATVGGL